MVRILNILGFVAASTTACFTARADFVLSTFRSQISTGAFAGDDEVVLSVQQNAVGAAIGNLISLSITESSITSSPRFYIRTWDRANGWFDTGAASHEIGNADADFSDQGLFEEDAVTPRPGGEGSYVRWGPEGSSIGTAQFVLLASSPSESTGDYEDLQSVSMFTVIGGEGGTAGVPCTTPTPIAVAVVPAGQEVSFSGQLSAISGSSPDMTLNVAPLQNGPPGPEPCLLHMAAMLALVFARRRSS